MATIKYTDDIVKVCSSMAEDYGRAARQILNPAERKLLDCIAKQKSDQSVALSEALSAMAARQDAAASPPSLNLGVFPAIPDHIELMSLLTLVVERESAFASLLDTLGREKSDEEARVALLALAEKSRKFASWAQDHIDLMGLF